MSDNKDELACTASRMSSLATRIELQAREMKMLCKELYYSASRIESMCTKDACDWDAMWQKVAEDVARAQAIDYVLADVKYTVHLNLEEIDELLESVGEAKE